MFDVLHWLPVRQRIEYRVVSLVWQCQLGLAPAYLIDLFRPVSGSWVADPFPLLRGSSGGPICLYSGYAEPRILCGAWALGFRMVQLRSCVCSLDHVLMRFMVI